MNLKVIYSPIHLEHSPQWEIEEGKNVPYAEKSDRIESIKDTLIEKRILVIPPKEFPSETIKQVHNKNYVSFISDKSASLNGTDEVIYPSFYIIDTYTPILAGTFGAAKSAVDVALTGAELISEGEKLAYSLCRPPGHHAEPLQMGGYCYFNNAAIAADTLSKKGKVAIFDIDFHHGNGTQMIFYERKDVLYVSIHIDPAHRFPYISGFANESGAGSGKGYNKNIPLPQGTNNTSYQVALKEALRSIEKYNPDFLVVSAGFDTYEKDPIGGFLLTTPFYEEIGKEIASLKKPTLIVQEGGYAVEKLGDIAYSFLTGISSFS